MKTTSPSLTPERIAARSPACWMAGPLVMRNGAVAWSGRADVSVAPDADARKGRHLLVLDFSDGARCNLNIQCAGDNEHHKIESIFKAVAKAMKMALVRDAAKMEIPSTKGVL